MGQKKDCGLSSGEKAAAKKIRAKENLAKSNPELAARNKAEADAKRERRKESGSTKAFK
jgi:hypothetical protein